MPTAASFAPRPNVDNYLSVFWQEYHDIDHKIALKAIRKEIRLTLAKSGRFASLPVGATIDAALEALDADVEILHWPEEEDGSAPSHSGIFMGSEVEEDVAALIASELTESQIHPAVE